METLRKLADAMRVARRITALTGAGVSAASGIPTFRGADRTGTGLAGAGLAGTGLDFETCPRLPRFGRPETLATPEAFENDPRLVWEWYDWRRQMIAHARPNAAHDVLARWTRERPGFTLITQNVDGLHEQAGAERLIRLHGSIWHVRCCGNRGQVLNSKTCPGKRDWLDRTVPFPSLPPRCPDCGAIVRPGVVWFGEPLDPETVAAARAACQCDLFLTIGTSSIVYPAAGLIHDARRHGARTFEINPDETEASNVVDVVIRDRAEQALAIVSELTIS